MLSTLISVSDLLLNLASIALGGIIAGLLAALLAPYVAHRLQLKRLQIEYALRHIKKTFLPILTDMNGTKFNVEQGALLRLKVDGYHPWIGSDHTFCDIKEQGSYEIMKTQDPKLVERIEAFYTQTLLLLNEVERTFDNTRNEIIRKWEEKLSDKGIPNLSRILATLHDDKRIIKSIYSNDKCDIKEVLKGHEYLRVLMDRTEIADVEQLIEVARPDVSKVDIAIKQAQEVFRKHKVDRLLEDIRKKIGRPI